MRFHFGVPALLLLSIPAYQAQAADQNGYTAQYECRAGGPNCNVDVASLGRRACDQIINPGDAWSTINWNYDTICIAAGDHTSKGTLRISASGSPDDHKVLRYYRADDSDDRPWQQSSANQAKISKIEFTGANYWVLTRLTFPTTSSAPGVRVSCGYNAGCDGMIFDRLLIEGNGSGAPAYTGLQFRDGNNITVQNSVVRNSWGSAGAEAMGVTPADQAVSHFHLVNNEIYDWSAHPLQVGNNDLPLMPGVVVENNDIYATGALNLSGGKSRMKNPVSIKHGSTSSNPARYIHNRIWGARNSTSSGVNINSDLGACMYFSVRDGASADYMLLQDNICMDSQAGITSLNGGTNRRNSVIGNIVYKLRNYTGGNASSALAVNEFSTSEFYLNTIVDVPDDASIRTGGTNNDVKCNLIIASRNFNGSGSGTDVNAYYGVAGSKLDANRIDHELGTISGTLCTTLGCTATANTSSFRVGDVVRTSTAATSCTAANDQDCFLYRVTAVGTSGQITAIRGPYAFYRKLQTKPELVVIPYAVPYAAPNDMLARAPEAYACPADYATRTGIGINDVN